VIGVIFSAASFLSKSASTMYKAKLIYFSRLIKLHLLFISMHCWMQNGVNPCIILSSSGSEKNVCCINSFTSSLCNMNQTIALALCTSFRQSSRACTLVVMFFTVQDQKNIWYIPCDLAAGISTKTVLIYTTKHFCAFST